jgi:hypothetical protein
LSLPYKSAERVRRVDEAIDIHHIFPQAWSERQEIKPDTYNSIVGKTPLTARTNPVIGGRARRSIWSGSLTAPQSTPTRLESKSRPTWPTPI